MPVLHNEENRIKSLLSYNLDYSALTESLSDLSKIAALSTNAPVAVISLIDADTQWIIGGYGIDFGQYPRDTSICQHTIQNDQPFEICTSGAENYFPDYLIKSGFQYYYGISIKSEEHYNIGTLCIIDIHNRQLESTQKEILKLLSQEVSRELSKYKFIEELGSAVVKAQSIKKKVVHDVRSPLQGIMGVAKIFKNAASGKTLKETAQAMDMIHKSSSSLLELTTEILESDSSIESDDMILRTGTTSISELSKLLQKLFLPKAISKNITFKINFHEEYATVPFSKGKILQISGNLISNALKFTPTNGTINLSLDLKEVDQQKELNILIQDTGVGIHPDLAGAILTGQSVTTEGTMGEKGFGYGLVATSQLVALMNGKLKIRSRFPSPGTEFHINVQV